MYTVSKFARLPEDKGEVENGVWFYRIHGSMRE